MDTTVFCAYKSTGKTTFTNAWKDEIKIADLSDVRSDVFPEEFEKVYRNVDVIFTNADNVTREYLKRKNIDYVLIYPKDECSDYYVCRMKDVIDYPNYTEDDLKELCEKYKHDISELDLDEHIKIVLDFNEVNTGIGMGIIKPYLNKELNCNGCLCPTCVNDECRNIDCSWCKNKKFTICMDYVKKADE